MLGCARGDRQATFNDHCQRYPTFDKANPSLGDIDSGCCTLEALDLNLSRLPRHLADLLQALPSPVRPSMDADTFGRRVVVIYMAEDLGSVTTWSASLDLFMILNTSPLPSLYEAFAITDGDERHRRLIQASSATSPGPPPIADQMAFAVFSGSDPRSSSDRPICSYYGNTGHIRKRCFKLHPKLREQFSKRKGKGHPRTATVADTSPGHVPDLFHI
ncbi:hypothetical protein Acr_08g0019290 [Actinidia rufa]|uniref:Uncharacterized protein n=1 Tax=Actinidia rufa TaxID=165716 RepID=A0A7J0F4L7_9ERIC|nr:hypothetical protein Acr_08g0019290 [Actinidia rufa]